MNFINLIVKPALRLLGPVYRRKGVLLIPLLLLQSLLDVVSVASFAPLALLMVRPESMRANTFLFKMYATFSFQSERSFALAWIGAIACFFLIKHAATIAITRLKAQFAFDVSISLSQKSLEHFMHLSYLEYYELQSSLEQVRIAHLPVSFANNILLALSTLITEGLLLFFIVTGLIIYDWRSVFFLAVIVLPAVFFYRNIKGRLNTIDHSLKTNYPSFIGKIIQLFENFIEINLYGKSKYFSNQIHQLNRELHHAHISQTVLQASSFRLFETTASMGLCLLTIYLVSTQAAPDVTIVLLGLYTAAGFRAIPSFNRIFNAILQIKSNEHVLTGLANLKTNGEKDDPELAVTFNSVLALKNISFGFPGRPTLLKNLSIVIERGSKIALTGPSGAGKTALLLIMMRFLKEVQGEILADGVLITRDNAKSWRKNIAYVPQQPVILDASLVENIAFGINAEKADRNKISELLQLLDLGPWISQLPEGLNTYVGEKGVKLSGGQRQRIAIARALYHDAHLMLLDEATSQVDSVTEQEVHRALNVFSSRPRTLVMVTHRQSALHFFDKVYHLNEGLLLEVLKGETVR